MPSKNTNMWTLQNCSKAFLKLSEQKIDRGCEVYEDIWPDYINDTTRPVFRMILTTQKELNYFLRKEKITLESR